MNQLEQDLEIAKNIFLPEILKDVNTMGVLFTGSRVINDANETSDFDFRVLLKDGAERYRNSIAIGGYFAETFRNPFLREVEYFAEQIKSRKPTDLFMYKTGIVIYDPAYEMAIIKRKAEELYNLGPEPLNQKSYDYIRYEIALNKLKLKGLSEKENYIYYFTDLTHKLISQFFELSNLWYVRQRFMDMEIIKHDPKFYEYLKSVSNSNKFNEKVENLILAIEHLQQKFELKDSIDFEVK